MAKFLSPDNIEDQAVRFLAENHPENTFPIPIEEIIEIGLGIDIVPESNLMRSHDIDGFITRDLKSIYIDLEIFLSSDHNFRARNTLAHEVGHFVLHAEYFESTDITSVESWKQHQRDNRELHRNLETQARMFAPYLLMPTDHLEKRFEHYKDHFASTANPETMPDDSILAEYIASYIGRDFNVSEQSANYRLKNWIAKRS